MNLTMHFRSFVDNALFVNASIAPEVRHLRLHAEETRNLGAILPSCRSLRSLEITTLDAAYFKYWFELLFDSGRPKKTTSLTREQGRDEYGPYQRRLCHEDFDEDDTLAYEPNMLAMLSYWLKDNLRHDLILESKVTVLNLSDDLVPVVAWNAKINFATKEMLLFKDKTGTLDHVIWHTGIRARIKKIVAGED
ncbi:uncharacterized protein AB675_7300 [Cyphellophora attinorum]|uniref:Uncharacterized protein n=1 Tax=Cyphellophora attinorum TaxID=1664694 RepID=A0A0N1HN34_9EURO|nr:uncharacterized protein AB675_7300 [Phialophora attinorum]KPI36345.1 hypothetical protein AB675_7300 [Phialophora attinorum]